MEIEQCIVKTIYKYNGGRPPFESLKR